MSTFGSTAGGTAWTCVTVLESFGVGPEAVAEAWGLDLREEASLRRAVALATGGGRVEAGPTAFLRESIAASPRCVDVPARYWDSALQVELAAAFGDVGAEVEVRDATGRPLSEGGAAAEPFEIAITDAEGETHAVEFSYPDTPMGRDNLGAAVAAVDDRLLPGTGFRFVPVAGPEDRWRFALVATDDLAALREEYGDAVAPFDGPLLGATDPGGYAPPDATVPSWADGDGGGAGLDRPEATFEPTGDPSPDAVLDGADPDEVAAADDDVAATDGGVVRGDFGAFAADLAGAAPAADAAGAESDAADATSDRGPVAPSADGDAASDRKDDADDRAGGDAGTGHAATGDGDDAVAVDPAESVDPTADDPGEGLDAAFAEIERAAVTEAADPAREASTRDAAAAIAEALASVRNADDAFGNPAAGWDETAGAAAESGFEWVGGDDLASR